MLFYLNVQDNSGDV